VNKQTIAQLLLFGGVELKNIADDQASFESEILLAFSLNKPRVYLHTWPDRNVPEDADELYDSLIQRRQQGEPIAYITGQREFWSLELRINADVLIPRSDTETLVEKALQQIEEIQNPHIIDLGTGSGAIALAIAKERPDANVTASDTSQAALEVAKKNAQQLGINNVTFIENNWCQNLPFNHYHLIISNPPYIASNDPHLTQGDLRCEPISALSSGEDGLDDIRIICHTAGQHLRKDGWLTLEHGYNQVDAVREIFDTENFSNLGHACDLNKIPRLSWGQKV